MKININTFYRKYYRQNYQIQLYNYKTIKILFDWTQFNIIQRAKKIRIDDGRDRSIVTEGAAKDKEKRKKKSSRRRWALRNSLCRSRGRGRSAASKFLLTARRSKQLAIKSNGPAADNNWQ